jgi:hypothetical protein
MLFVNWSWSSHRKNENAIGKLPARLPCTVGSSDWRPSSDGFTTRPSPGSSISRSYCLSVRGEWISPGSKRGTRRVPSCSTSTRAGVSAQSAPNTINFTGSSGCGTESACWNRPARTSERSKNACSVFRRASPSPALTAESTTRFSTAGS